LSTSRARFGGVSVQTSCDHKWGLPVIVDTRIAAITPTAVMRLSRPDGTLCEPDAVDIAPVTTPLEHVPEGRFWAVLRWPIGRAPSRWRSGPASRRYSAVRQLQDGRAPCERGLATGVAGAFWVLGARFARGRAVFGLTFSFRTCAVRGRWNTCDMSLKALSFPRHVARGVDRRAREKRPRTGGHRPGTDTEEDLSMVVHRNQSSSPSRGLTPYPSLG